MHRDAWPVAKAAKKACRRMNILLITTVAHNPGDEFIRLGVEHVLRLSYPAARFKLIHKHDPRTLFSGFEQRPRSPSRFVSPYLYRLYAKSRGRHEENFLETADLVVFAGTPFIWRSSARLFPFTSENAEWVNPIWRRLFNDFPRKPVLNLSAGTSLTGGTSLAAQDQADAILSDPVVAGFLKQAAGRAQLTTARDVRTSEILGALGFQTKIIPCASIMAAAGAHLRPLEPEYVVINTMRSAAHSWRGQRGDESKWRNTITAVVPEIEKRHPVLFVSHSRLEDETAAAWFPGRRRFLSKSPSELLYVYSKARYGLCNRIHAAAAVASFGRPAIVVGGDSRVNLIEQFGLPAYDHRDIDGSKLSAIIGEVESHYDKYVHTLKSRTIAAEHDYVRAIASISH
jgi:hypothetical protein